MVRRRCWPWSGREEGARQREETRASEPIHRQSDSIHHKVHPRHRGIPSQIFTQSHLDDASRFVVGYGLFPEATSEHSVEVLKEAIRKHGKPASILTDRGIQFYAVEADDIIQPDIARVGGISEARKITAMASAFDIPITLHVGLSGPGCRAATLQLAPVLPRELVMNYEIYFLPNPLHTDIIDRPIERFSKGYLEVPSGPGLNLEINQKKMSRFLVKR